MYIYIQIKHKRLFPLFLKKNSFCSLNVVLNLNTTMQIINKYITPNINIKPLQDSQEYIESFNDIDRSIKKSVSFSQKLSLIFSSIALGSDGYQANIIGAVESCLSKIYGPQVLANGLSTRVSNAMLIGDIFGQIGFGFIIDRLGRKIGIVACTLFVCLVSIYIIRLK